MGKAAEKTVTNEPGNSYKFERIISSLAGILIIGLVGYLLVRNEPIADPRLFLALRVMLSLTAATMGATIPGFLNIGWKGSGFVIRAGGALALFILTFIYTPDTLPQQNQPEKTMAPSTALPATALLAVGASEAETYNNFIDYAAYRCISHSKERTTTGIRNVKIEALRVMAKLGYFLCPYRMMAITPEAAVLFYPDLKVFTWDPERPDSVKGLREVTDKLTSSEEFPVDKQAWDAEGKLLTEQTFPSSFGIGILRPQPPN
jgi:hypothetical protein